MHQSNPHLSLRHPPFANSAGVVLGTEPVRKAILRIRTDLAVGAHRICVAGPPGIGKTSLARVLPRALEGFRAIAGIGRQLDPHRPWEEMRRSITVQLGLQHEGLCRDALRARCRGGRRMLLVFDAAEALSCEHLDHLDLLLGMLDDEFSPLFQCVVIADIDSGGGSKTAPLHAWLDPRSLHMQLEPLSSRAIHGYIEKRLEHAGWRGGRLFSLAAGLAIHQVTGGVPRSVNELCHRVMERARGRRFSEIGADLVEEVLNEPASPDGDQANAHRAPERGGWSPSTLEPIEDRPSAWRKRAVGLASDGFVDFQR